MWVHVATAASGRRDSSASTTSAVRQQHGAPPRIDHPTTSWPCAWASFRGVCCLSGPRGNCLSACGGDNPEHAPMCCWRVGRRCGSASSRLAATKLPHYIIPPTLAVALMVGCFLETWISHPDGYTIRLQRLAWGVVLAVGLAAMVGIPLAARRSWGARNCSGHIGLPLVLGALAG